MYKGILYKRKNNIKKHYQNILEIKMKNKLTFFGFFILLFIIYRRLFKIQLPREIIPTEDIILVSINIILCISTFILACVNIYMYIKFILKKHETPIKNKILQKMIKIFQSKWNPLIIWNTSLHELDVYIKNNIPYYDEHRDYLDVMLIFMGNFFCKFEKSVLYILILIHILCQSIVLFAFFIDIFIFSKLYYFYRCLWLLIFPLILKYIIYSIKTLLDTNINSLEDVLVLKVVLTTEYVKYQLKASFFQVSIADWKNITLNTPKNSYLCLNTLSDTFIQNKPLLDHESTLKYCVNSMEEFFLIYGFIDEYALLKKKIILPFDVIKSILYCICWGTIVMKMIL